MGMNDTIISLAWYVITLQQEIENWRIETFTAFQIAIG